MVGERRETNESRVLICAPHGRDASLIATMLVQHGIGGNPVTDLAELSAEIERGVGAAVLTEEALNGSMTILIDAMKNQPPWSDLPLIILTTGGEIRSQRTW